MTTAEEGAASTAILQDVQALGWLVAVLANLGVGAWLLQQATLADPPPLLAFVLFSIASLVLLIAPGNRAKQAPEHSMEAEKAPSTANNGGLLWKIALPGRLSRRRAVLLLLALVLSAYTLFRLPQLDRLESHATLFLFWALSIICYALALAPPGDGVLRRWGQGLATVWRHKRLPLLILLNIVVVSLLLRASFLEAVPYTLGGDEASQGLEAVRVLQGEIRNPFTTGWLGVPTLSFFFNAISIELLGMTKSGLRLPWALVGTATVVAAFFLVRRLHGLTLALATAALLGVYHYHIHFSRLGSNQIADPLFVAVSLALLYYALQRKEMWAWVATGVTVGLAFYFYAGARFTPVIVLALAALAVVALPRRAWRPHLQGILAMGGGFLLTAAPMLQYAVRFPDDFNARLNQVGIIQSGWLARELADGKGLLPTLWDQLQRAALAFNHYPDRTVWYGLQEPLLDPFFGALFAVGLLLSTLLVVVRRDQRLLPFVLWWWGGMLAGGMLTESPPSSQRLTTLTVPVCFFIAFALWRIISLAHSAVPRLPRRLLLALGVAAFAVVSLNLYFLEFTPQYRYGGRHAELATTLEPILAQVEGTHDAFFVGAPWMYWGFATIPFLSPDMQGRDLEEPVTAQQAAGLLRPQRGAVFIVRPERMAEMAAIQEAFPRGVSRELHSRAPDGELLATLYLAPPQP